MSVLLGGHRVGQPNSWQESSLPDGAPCFYERELHIWKSEGQLFVLISLVEGVTSYTVEAHLRKSLVGIDIPSCSDELRATVVRILGSFIPDSPHVKKMLAEHRIASAIALIDTVEFTPATTG